AHLIYNRGCSSIGEPNFPPAFLALLHGSASQCDNNWAFLAEYAWVHHETGALDEAMRLAQRSLHLNPTNAVAVHSMTHVYFERADAVAGADFLGNWLAEFDCPASSYVHLSWHLALFELALGQYQRAIERYEQDIRPYVVAKSIATLADSASFLWRVQIYSSTPSSHPAAPPWEDVRALARASFDAATQSWRIGDAASPEMAALNRFAAAVN
ncbi:MAG: hypothetical protein O7G88_21940, partial [bacterium]|nr:hypothetical protein [bacterium]